MTITLRILKTSDVEDLYPRLRIEDKEECIILGSNPREALIMGALDNIYSASKGRAYAIISSENGLIGAIGFTSAGYLWALSTKFSFLDLKELWTRTPEITKRLLAEAKVNGVFTDGFAPYFHNIIHTRNKVALRWLQRSKVFGVFPESPVDVGGEVFYPFRTLMPFEMANKDSTVCKAI